MFVYISGECSLPWPIITSGDNPTIWEDASVVVSRRDMEVIDANPPNTPNPSQRPEYDSLLLVSGETLVR